MAQGPAPFFVGEGGRRLSEEEVKRRRDVASAMMKSGTDASPVQHWTQGAARVVQALMGGYQARKANEAESANRAEDAKIGSALVAQLLGGGDVPAAPAPVSADVGSTPAPVPAPASLLPRFAQAEAQYGLPNNYLAQTANIESRFNPNAQNPNSSAGGLFQFVDGTAKQYGLANKFDPAAATEAAARLAADNAKVLSRALGRAPTAGELYLAHQQGGGGAAKLLANPNARAVDIVGADAVRLNGGNASMTAGEFAKRWTSKLAANEADMPAAGAVPAEMATGQTGFVIPPGEQAAPAPMSGNTFNAISEGRPLDPVFQTEGVAQPWMGTALAPQAPAQPQMAQAPLPPSRPADLAMPQADMPAPSAVPAIGQMPQAPIEDLSNTPDAGARAGIVQALMAQQGQAGAGPATQAAGMAPVAPQAAAVPAQTASPSPAVAQVAQALSQQPSEVVSQALMSQNPAVQRIAALVLQQRIEAQKPKAQWVEERLPDGSLAQRNTATGERKILRPSDLLSPEQEAQKTRLAAAGRTQVNVGGGSDKQIFDTVKESSDAARAAASGLNSVREARAAVKGGAILGAGADAKLQLQKLGAAFGVVDPSKIVNTETFRSAIAPAVASLLKSTVGSANISNSDREFAEKAAGGSISLDEGTITRLLDIMERGNVAILEGHQKRMDAIYPDDVANKRERALFGVPIPAAPQAAPSAAAPDRAALEAEARRRGLLK